jgi:hypothetical protein
MRIIDESERVREIAVRAFDPNSAERRALTERAERRGLGEIRDHRHTAAISELRDIWYPAADAAEAALWSTGEWKAAVDAAGAAYLQHRRRLVAYRISRGMPTEADPSLIQENP